MDDDRDVGSEFVDLQDDLEGEEYPIAADPLERYGDRRLEHANDAVTPGGLREETSKEAYEPADDVHRAVLDSVGDDADGGRDYADREPDGRGEGFERGSF